MQERELVKITSDNPAHPKGYYIQFKDRMNPGDVIFGETKPVIHETDSAAGETMAPEKPTNRKKVKR